jgi:hypothetical protein
VGRRSSQLLLSLLSSPQPDPPGTEVEEVAWQNASRGRSTSNPQGRMRRRLELAGGVPFKYRIARFGIRVIRQNPKRPDMTPNRRRWQPVRISHPVVATIQMRYSQPPRKVRNGATLIPTSPSEIPTAISPIPTTPTTNSFYILISVDGCRSLRPASLRQRRFGHNFCSLHLVRASGCLSFGHGAALGQAWPTLAVA